MIDSLLLLFISALGFLLAWTQREIGQLEETQRDLAGIMRSQNQIIQDILARERESLERTLR